MIDKRAVRRLYLAGHSGLKIAQAFGTSKHTIYRLLDAMKVARRGVGRTSVATQPKPLGRLIKREGGEVAKAHPALSARKRSDLELSN